MLYAARRRLRTAASRLPELPDTLFGWIPVLYKISDDEILASAGLDAFAVSYIVALRRGQATDDFDIFE